MSAPPAWPPVRTAVGAASPICEPRTHAWQVISSYPGWLACARCCALGQCKACLVLAGESHPGWYPDIFCPAHQGEAHRYRALPVSYSDLVGRVILLAGSIPASAWHDDETLGARNPGTTASVLAPGIRLALTHSYAVTWWRVLVFDGVRSASPSLIAEGPALACSILTLQPGAWIAALCEVETLLGAEVLP